MSRPIFGLTGTIAAVLWFFVAVAIVFLILLILGLIIAALGGGVLDLHIGKFFFDAGVHCASNCG